MRRALLAAFAALLPACSFDQAFTDYCVELGACSCTGTTCCMVYGSSCDVGYPCCEGLVCKSENLPGGVQRTCRRSADALLTLNPPVYDFGFVDLGASSSTTVTVTNAGLGPSSPLVFDPLEAPFAVDAACAGQVLAPGASCQITLTANGSSRGRFSKQLRITEIVSSVQLVVSARVGVHPVQVSAGGATPASVVSDPPGISCPAVCAWCHGCDVDFPAGAVLTLSSGTPALGYWFNGFYGDCVTSGTTCTLVVDGPKTVYVWEIPNVTLNVASGGLVNVLGWDYPSTGYGWALPLYGPTVFTAKALPPASFTGWSDGCSPAGLDASCTLDVTGPVAVTANFAP